MTAHHSKIAIQIVDTYSNQLIMKFLPIFLLACVATAQVVVSKVIILDRTSYFILMNAVFRTDQIDHLQLFNLFYFSSQPNSKADHVKLTLYYESLCGGCHQWITGEFHETYQKLGQYIEIDFVPYGNAHVRMTLKS